MPKENNKILKYNHGEKYMKVLFVNYADLLICLPLKKYIIVIIILKSHQQLKQLSI